MVCSRIKALKRLIEAIENSPSLVKPIPGAFELPSSIPVVIGREHVSLNEFCVESLHEELSELADAEQEAARLKECVRAVGFPDLVSQA